jgi:hypothetical protein
METQDPERERGEREEEAPEQGTVTPAEEGDAEQSDVSDQEDTDDRERLERLRRDDDATNTE